jgi:hypothetical protein
VPQKMIQCSLKREELSYVHHDNSLETISTASAVTDSCFVNNSDTTNDGDIADTPPSSRYRGVRSPPSESPRRTNPHGVIDSRKRPRRQKRKVSMTLIYFALAAATILLGYNSVVHKSRVILKSQLLVWQRFLQEDAEIVRQKIANKAPGDELTIQLRGGRLDLIQHSLDAHSRCTVVKEIQVEWLPDSDGGNLPPSLLYHDGGKTSEIGKLSTNAVLLLSEETVFSCDEIERGTCRQSRLLFVPQATVLLTFQLFATTAFRTWQEDSSRLVGFFPFRLTASNSRRGNDSGIENVPESGGSYSLLSDTAVFVHRLYIQSLPYIRQPTPCKTFLLSLQVSVVTAKPPIAIAACPWKMLGGDESFAHLRGGGRDEKTTQCILDWMLASGVTSLPNGAARYIGSR